MQALFLRYVAAVIATIASPSKHTYVAASLSSPLFGAAFLVSFWGLTVAQTYVDKVNERSWLPYIGIFILCHFSNLPFENLNGSVKKGIQETKLSSNKILT